MGEAAALQIGHVFPLQAAAKLQEQTRFAHPRLALDADHLPVPPLCLFQQRGEDLQFALPPHKGGQALRRGHVDAGAPGLSASELEHLHRVMALERRCTQ